MKIPAAKAAVDKDWEKLEKFSAWNLTKVRSKKQVVDEARTSGAEVHFASLMDICHLKNAALEAKHQKYECRVVLRGVVEKGRFWLLRSIHRTRIFSISNDSPPKSWISSPDCQVAMDKQLTRYLLIPKWKWKMLTNYWKFQNRSVQTFGFVYHDTNGQKHGPVWKTQSFLLKRNLYGHPLSRLLRGKSNWRKSYWNTVGWKFPIVNAYSYTVGKRILLICVCGWHQKLAGKKRNINPMWKVLNKEVDLGEPTSLLDHVYLGCTQRQREISKDIVDNYRIMFESRISAGGTEKNYDARKIWVFLHGLMIWKVMPRNVWNDFVSWQTRRLNNSTKYQLHALTTIISKKKNWNPWENCQKYALKLFRNAYTWHVVDDPIFYGVVNKLARSITKNGAKRVTNCYLVWSLTFIIHVITNNIVMWETLQNNADWDCFRTPILQEILTDSKSTSSGTLCFFESHTFVPISWMCQKQTSVSHSTTESENHFFGCKFKDGRYTRAWLMGSDCYCFSRKYESEWSRTARPA